MTKKKQRGRPKGGPTIKRSIALRKELNDYLVNLHEKTMIPYNSLINMAVEQMLLTENSNSEEK